MGDSGTSKELDGAGACQSPKVGLAEVGVAHVDGMEEIAYDGQALEKRIGTRKRFVLIARKGVLRRWPGRCFQARNEWSLLGACDEG